MRDRLVLCYHALSERWPAALSTTPERFAAQLADLRRRGYAGTTFSALAAGRAPRRAVAVTFDDGYASVRELAKPLLDAHGWPATIFVPTDFPGSGRPLAWEGTDRWLGTDHEHELRGLGWDELRALAAAGWEVGSHTRSHPRLTRLDDATLRDELAGSRAACAEQLGDCRSLAYPYGDADARVVRAAADAGYTTAALLAVPVRDRPLAWGRVGVYHVDDRRRFRLKTARVTRMLGPWPGRALARARRA